MGAGLHLSASRGRYRGTGLQAWQDAHCSKQPNGLSGAASVTHPAPWVRNLLLTFLSVPEKIYTSEDFTLRVKLLILLNLTESVDLGTQEC
jgi:hypothetical protein